MVNGSNANILATASDSAAEKATAGITTGLGAGGTTGLGAGGTTAGAGGNTTVGAGLVVADGVLATAVSELVTVAVGLDLPGGAATTQT
jgi:hypothetical protein